MKNINQYGIIFLFGLIIISAGCQKNDYQLGDLVAPTNVTLTYEIVGADAENPNGDGSGKVNFTATADHAITFNFDFGDGKDNEVDGDGKVSHTFSLNGINTFNVTVYAVGTGGITSNKTAQLSVFSSFSDEEALLFLTGGSSKSWYWAADQPGHLGLGPNDQKYDNGNHTYPAWYQAAPWEKSATTLYDCEFVFSVENGKMTFEQKNPRGEAFIQGLYAAEFGLGDEGSYPFDIAGIKNATFSPSSSIATIDGGYRGTTITYSDGGFMGFYAGSSEYEIIEVTENILKVRMVQANQPLFAWYHIFTNVKPVR
jgi:hypothetical protein